MSFTSKPNFHITLYQPGTLAQLQLNLHNHVLALCAFYKSLSISLPESMSSALSATVPLGLGFCTYSCSEAENDCSILTVVIEL
jgi:hypothetical protein